MCRSITISKVPCRLVNMCLGKTLQRASVSILRRMKFQHGIFSVTRLESELWLADNLKIWKTGNPIFFLKQWHFIGGRRKGAFPCKNGSLSCRTCPKQGRSRAYFRAVCHRNDKDGKGDLQEMGVCQTTFFLRTSCLPWEDEHCMSWTPSLP